MSRLTQLQKLHAADPIDADVLYMLAQEHAQAGDYAEARRWYDRCIEADPAYLYAYFHKARAQQASDDTAGAVETLRTGSARAKSAGDAKAEREILALIDELGG